ncbi:NAD(P)-binding domain-containing protein [Paracoccus marinaquae]|uniref:NAD(P)-binding domain-containing protein n=1 Tax=Paracoccus marinaquae TaxID=2841926 RepID=A0ABS6ADT8_9RHOB|nr:NAD(P)-binding domain-containing protein [Paracoccus marinaquae]MBU3028753.1 NAD(P)-binding domain-containing protein [Paracoccus marinaquae]
MSRIGVIGTGHIAAPMVHFLASRGHRITVSARNARIAAALRAELGVAIADPQQVIDAADILLLCLRPDMAEPVLAPLRFRAGQKIVSVMAGVSAARLSSLCAPAGDLVQTIPLGFLRHGGCPLAAFGNTALLADLFGPENPVVPVPHEAALNAHFAICAMVPGLLDLMNSGADWLTRQTGDADSAEFYTSQLMAGFLGAMDRGRAGRLAAERDALATDGTLSLQMTTALREGGAHETLLAALSAIGARLEAAR